MQRKYFNAYNLTREDIPDCKAAQPGQMKPRKKMQVALIYINEFLTFKKKINKKGLATREFIDWCVAFRYFLKINTG